MFLIHTQGGKHGIVFINYCGIFSPLILISGNFLDLLYWYSIISWHFLNASSQEPYAQNNLTFASVLNLLHYIIYICSRGINISRRCVTQDCMHGIWFCVYDGILCGIHEPKLMIDVSAKETSQE